MGDGRTRRAFLIDLGRTTAGLVVVSTGLGGCSRAADPVSAQSPRPSQVPSASPVGTSSGTGTDSDQPAGVDLGFVAAYVVQRDGQAAVIDTGVEDSEAVILTVLEGLGLGWDAVSDVIVTHSHGDHAGSLPAVAQAAPDAVLSAGQEDISNMTAPRQIMAVGGGDTVFDLQIIPTPGHTPGHISVFDPAAGWLFTGDAMVGQDGQLAGPSAQFTPDMDTAIASLDDLVALEPSQIFVSHGFPIDADAADLSRVADELRG